MKRVLIIILAAIMITTMAAPAVTMAATTSSVTRTVRAADGEWTVTVTIPSATYTGWVLAYYADKNGKSRQYVYMQNGDFCHGWKYSGGKWFYLDKDKKTVRTGWIYDDGYWYFCDYTTGEMQTGWLDYGGNRYYLSGSGKMVANDWIREDNYKWYYFDNSGIMAKSKWVSYKDGWYYLGADGVMAIGWLTEGNSLYYLDSTGKMAANCWMQKNGTWYYLKSNGKGVAATKTLTLKKQNGTGGTNSVPVVQNSTLMDITVPTRTGYKFAGYYTKTNGNGTQYYDASGKGTQTWTSTNGATLYAYWKPVVTVKFDANGGTSTFADQEFTYDNPEDQYFTGTISRTGYTFLGWSTSKTNTDTSSYYGINSYVTNNWINTRAGKTVTLYAMWSPVTVKVKFDANGGTSTFADQEFTYDNPENRYFVGTITRSGYTFLGWSTSKTNTDTSSYYGINSYVTNNWINTRAGKTVTLYAMWKKNAATTTSVKVTYDANGGSLTSASTQTFTTGKTDQKFSGSATKSGCTLVGWSKTKGSTTVDFGVDYAVKDQWIKSLGVSTMTVYAVWQNNTTTTTTASVTVIFDANGGSYNTYGTQVYKAGTSGQYFKGSLVRSGYILLGWSETKNPTNGDYYSPNSNVTDSWIKTRNGKTVRLYAVWEKEKTVSSVGDTGQFEIQYFMGPDANAIVADPNIAVSIANAGFSVISLRSNWNSFWKYDNLGAALDILASKDAGNTLGGRQIKVYLSMGNISDLAIAKAWNTGAKNAVTPYLNGSYSNVIGVDIGDEPSINRPAEDNPNRDLHSNTSYVANALSVINKNFGTNSYLNLFPNYVSEGMMENYGNSDEGAYNNDTKEKYDSTYLPAFLNSTNYGNGLKVFSVDNYPRLKDANYDTTSKSREYYYANLVQLLTLSQAEGNKGAVPMNVVALHDWFIDPTNQNHITYQVNTNLAFGMKRLSYFTYSEPSISEANKDSWTDWNGWLVDEDGETTGLYSKVSNINKWAKNVGNLLFDETVVSISQVTGTTQKDLFGEYKPALGKVTSNSNTTGVVTEFVGNNGRIVMLTNGSAKTSTTFTLNKQYQDVEYYNATSGKWIAVPQSGTRSCGSGSITFSCNATTMTVTVSAGGAVLLKHKNDDGIVITEQIEETFTEEATIATLFAFVGANEDEEAQAVEETAQDVNASIASPEEAQPTRGKKSAEPETKAEEATVPETETTAPVQEDLRKDEERKAPAAEAQTEPETVTEPVTEPETATEAAQEPETTAEVPTAQEPETTIAAPAAQEQETTAEPETEPETAAPAETAAETTPETQKDQTEMMESYDVKEEESAPATATEEPTTAAENEEVLGTTVETTEPVTVETIEPVIEEETTVFQQETQLDAMNQNVQLQEETPVLEENEETEQEEPSSEPELESVTNDAAEEETIDQQ